MDQINCEKWPTGWMHGEKPKCLYLFLDSQYCLFFF